MCGYCFQILSDEREDLTVKQTIFRYFCIPVLTSCSPYVLTTLLCAPWKSLKVQINGYPSGDSVSVVKRLYEITQKETKISDSVYTVNGLLYLQTCCYKLFEVAYDKCSLSSLKGDIAKAFSGPESKGNELTGAVSKSAYKHVRTSLPNTADPVIIQLLYCAAFGCLAITVAKSQSEEKFFDMFLFKEKPGECVWRRIVDCSVTYRFECTTAKFDTVYIGPPGVTGEGSKGKSGRRRGRGRGRGGDSGSVGSYVSQYLSGTMIERSSLMTQTQLAPFGSKSKTRNLGANSSRPSQSQAQSLSQSQMEFEDLGLGSTNVHPLKGSGYSQYASDYEPLNSENENDGDVVCGLDDRVIALEMNDLNTQSCMTSMLRIVQRMNYLFGTSDNMNSNSVKSGKWREEILPNWLMEVKDRLSDYTGVSRNVRLFLLRLLLNQPVSLIVAPYANHLLPAVIECCNTDLCDPEIGDGYHYFLRDVVFTLCDSWGQVLSNTEEDPFGGIGDQYTQVSRLISHLIKHSYNDESDVLKENVQSIGALVRLFKDPPGGKGLHLSLAAVAELLTVDAGPTGGANAAAKSKGSEGVRKRLAGLSILKVRVV